MPDSIYLILLVAFTVASCAQVKPHVVALCFDPQESLEHLGSFWLPALATAPLHPLVALLALKFDEDGALSNAPEGSGDPIAALEARVNPVMQVHPIAGEC